MTEEPPAKQWIDEYVTVATGQTIAFGLSMLALGIWFGNQITGRLATAAWPAIDIIQNGQPEWLTTVEAVNWAALGVFCLGIAAVVILDLVAAEN